MATLQHAGVEAVVAAVVGDRPQAGGHRCAISAWADGLRATGCNVTLVDAACPSEPACPDETELVLNVMGALAPDSLPDAARRVFVDIDPGYPQMWSELGLADVLADHHAFVTLGENIARAGCVIPDLGIDWVATPPPVSVRDWPAVRGGNAFTTVATWRNGYGTVERNGITYGSRVHEFRKFAQLPLLVDAEFELALEIDPAERADIDLLESCGWQLVDPRLVAPTPARYRSFIQASKAEFCVAQNMYVATRSGWLSDRSVCYLASGKPVLAQDTGFTANYPVGEGLLAFSTLEEAAAGVEEIERNYERHCVAARALAEEFFDAGGVLARILEQLRIRDSGGVETDEPRNSGALW